MWLFILWLNKDSKKEKKRHWLKSATYFKSLVPTWTYLNKNTIHLRNGLWHLQIDRILALCPLEIGRILARWSLVPELPIRVPMLCVHWNRQCPELTEFNKGHKNTTACKIYREKYGPSLECDVHRAILSCFSRFEGVEGPSSTVAIFYEICNWNYHSE